MKLAKSLMVLALSMMMVIVLAACGIKIPVFKVTNQEHSFAVSKPTEISQIDNISINNCSAGDIITYGLYDQDNNTNNGKEPIEWIVLERDTDKALLISKHILDKHLFSTGFTGVDAADWKTSDLRDWLNNEFFYAAFSEIEQKKILRATFDDYYYPYKGLGTPPEKTDRVFILGVEEIRTRFASNDESRATDFNGKESDWWLRSSPTGLGYVENDGVVTVAIITNNAVKDIDKRAECERGVRPVIWIELEPDETESQENEVYVDLDLSGDKVFFGKYKDRIAYLEWNVVERQDDRVLLITRRPVTSHRYDNGQSDETWETSEIRSWLNNVFLKVAFTKDEQTRILPTTIQNPDNPKYGTDGGNDTIDKIFLLSLDEVEKYFATDGEVNPERNMGGWWWLRSPGSSPRSAACVALGDIEYDGDIFGYEYGIYPTMWISIE